MQMETSTGSLLYGYRLTLRDDRIKESKQRAPFYEVKYASLFLNLLIAGCIQRLPKKL